MNKKISIIISLLSLALIFALIFLVLPMAKEQAFTKKLEKATLKWLIDNEIVIEKELEISLFQLTGSGYLQMIEDKKDDKYLSLASIIKINSKKEITFEKKYTSKKIYNESKNLKYSYDGKYNEVIQTGSEINFEDLLIEVGQGKYNPELIIIDEYGYETMIMTDFKSKYTLKYYVYIDEEKISFIRTIEVKDTEAPIIEFNETTIIKVNEVKNFDFKKDVKVTDNERVIEDYIVTGELKELPGTYEIKYYALDLYGNDVEKTRTIIVE